LFKCYGRNLSNNKPAQLGDAVGIIAAQSIGEPGTQLTLRTFHTGGAAASVASDSNLVAKFDGRLEFDTIRTVKQEAEDGTVRSVIIGRTGEINIIDDTDRVLLTNNIPYGSILHVKDGQKVKKGDVLCSWDPYNNVIVSEFKGIVKYEDIIDGITYREEIEEQKGHIDKVTIESRDKKRVPAILVTDEKGKEIASYSMPVGVILLLTTIRRSKTRYYLS
jgi:DNA-directed RNA polymerase subunit beta'